MKKHVKKIGITIVALILTLLIMRFYALPTPFIIEYLVGIFIVALFLVSLIYWIYYGFRKYIFMKQEEEFVPRKRLREITYEEIKKANTDRLTDLYNNRHFHERLEQEIARNFRFSATFSLIMVDIDLFNAFHDIYGRKASHQILRKVAEYVKVSIRGLDIPFYYGFDEFAVILPEAQLNDAYIIAERIRKSVDTRIGIKAFPLTVSLGIANCPVDGVTSEEVIAAAEAALLRAKQTGRNRTFLSSDVVEQEVPLSRDSSVDTSALSIVYALAATVDAKDHYTYGHSKKVSDYAVHIAEALDLPKDKVDTIRAASLLHDIGKIEIPNTTLNKEGSLTETEWKLIKEHPQTGVEILQHVIDLVNCMPGILHHHERYDGKGYPSGLKGESIPLEARILAISNAYDSTTSLRPYREQLSSEQALDELKRCAGSQFDPKLVDIFCKFMESA
ncbi:HD domain-containing phosphohydrolase [Chloroflexota bacterium]